MNTKNDFQENPIENREISPVNLIASPDLNLLPRVAPNVSRYGFFNYTEINNYHSHQSIAYYANSVPENQRLLFGISNSESETSSAYIYETDMNLKYSRHVLLASACHISDMMFLNDGRLMIAPVDYTFSIRAIVRIYIYPELVYYSYRDLSAHFGNNYIDGLCHSAEDKMYIIKAGSKVVFFDYNFIAKKTIDLDLSDKHGDPLTPQTIEYYKKHLLQLNSGDHPAMGLTKNAYLNIYDPSGSKIDTYRYPDSNINMQAQGICNIGNGKFLFTHYGGPRIEVRQLDFNTPSHTHTLSDIIDLEKLGIIPKTLYVNPALAGGSYLAPDGSQEKPFLTIDEAVAYAKMSLSGTTIYLMDGNYGDVKLNNIYADIQLKGLNKEACLVDKVSLNKCRDLTFENITFTSEAAPFEAYSASVEISDCLFPNGKLSDSRLNGNYGINIGRNCDVTLRACEINNFNSAVKIDGSTLYLEGSRALSGSGNCCGIQGERSVILGSEELSDGFYTAQKMSVDRCTLENEEQHPEKIK